MNVKTLLAKQIVNLDSQVSSAGNIDEQNQLHIQLHGYLRTYYDYFGTEELPEQKETAANATAKHELSDSNGTLYNDASTRKCFHSSIS